MDKTETKLAGWEREFWKLLSPETARLLKAELARPSPQPMKPRRVAKITAEDFAEASGS